MKKHLRTSLFVAIVLLVALPGFAGVRFLEIDATHPQRATGTPQFKQVASGIEYLQLARGHRSEQPTTGPWLINLLRVDPARTRIEFVRALDAGVGLETTSSLARRYDANVAVNGGYFRTTGVYRGESVGVYQLRGRLISDTHNDRAAIGLVGNGDRTSVVLGHLGFSGEIRTSKSKHRIHGLNRPRAQDELIIFTPEFHRTTLTTPDGIEVSVQRDRAISIRDSKGSTLIPADGYVISAAGTARDWVMENVQRGTKLTLLLNLIAIDKAQREEWGRAHSIVGGGPQLIRAGKIAITNAQEKILPAFVSDLHPRTAFAKLASGKLLLVTVDGRQPERSIGMSLNMLTDLLLEFGAVEAINLDGGGSTTMVIHNKVVNSPSDQGGERPVSDAILIFAKSALD